MPTYAGTVLNDLNPTYPAEHCSPAELNDAIREIKTCVKNTFGVDHDNTTGRHKKTVGVMNYSGTPGAGYDVVLLDAYANADITLPTATAGKVLFIKRVDVAPFICKLTHPNLVGGDFYLNGYMCGATLVADGAYWMVVGCTSNPYMGSAYLGTNATEITLAGLSVLQTQGFRVYFDLLCANTSAVDITLNVNGDGVLTNYYRQLGRIRDGSIALFHDNMNRVGNFHNSLSTIITGWMDVIVTPAGICQIHGRYGQFATYHEDVWFSLRRVPTVTDVNSIAFVIGVTNGFKAGTQMSAYKLERG
jgi:hypothetical protein